MCCSVLQCVAVCCSAPVSRVHWRRAAYEKVSTPHHTAKNIRESEYRLFYRALLKKRPVILRSLLIKATLYKKVSTAHQNAIKSHEAPQLCDVVPNYRSLLQKSPIKETLFCVFYSRLNSVVN